MIRRLAAARVWPWASGLMLIAAAVLDAQRGAASGEWRTYGGDLGHTRYAPLDQIDAKNFSTLEIAWRFKTDNLGPRPEFQFESTPLVANGVLYSTAGARRAVVALDAATGELRWVYSLDEGKRGEAAPRQLSGRGLSYWTDGKEERILYVTPGYQLIALDAKIGRPIASFGSSGIVDLKQQMDQDIDPMSREIGLHSTPIVAGDVVVVGAAHRSGGVPTGKSNVKGFIRGFDVRTGKRLWIFKTIPSPGELGHDTWLEDSSAYTGNTGAWTQISVDPELGLAYLPVESATGDYYGGHRPGANLFAESLVAVDLKTGVRKWHFQLVHHGIWDMDLAVRADPGRPHGQRPRHQGGGCADQAGLLVRVQPRDRRAGVADRGTARPQRRRATRVVFADAAVSHEAAGLRSTGLADRRSPRLHAGAPSRGRAARLEVQDRPDLHAAGGEQDRWPAGDAGDGHGSGGTTGPAGRSILKRRLWMSRRRNR